MFIFGDVLMVMKKLLFVEFGVLFCVIEIVVLRCLMLVFVVVLSGKDGRMWCVLVWMLFCMKLNFGVFLDCDVW